MSFLTPVRQVPRSSALFIALRQASSSSNAPRTVSASSVQKADEQLALRQKQQAALRRSGRQMDIMSASIQVLESTVEPPFQLSWITQKGFFRYLVDRAKRYWGGTRASLLQMRKRGIAPARLAGSTFENLRHLFTNRIPSVRYSPMLGDLCDVYREYNTAIAKNDGMNLRALAIGEALAHGQAVIKANKRMEWSMKMGDHAPRILWARVAQVHEDAEVGQVAVRFDTKQMLRTVTAGKQNTRTSRVVENYVFERMMPIREGWKIKQRVEFTLPPIGENYEVSKTTVASRS